MRVTVDTNVLVRAVMRDDEQQALAAVQVLQSAEILALPLPCLCEFVWVLRSVYGLDAGDIASALHALLGVQGVAVERLAVEAGLDILKDGGDFADGVIAYEGRRLGGEIFASFDKKAVSQLTKQGHRARLLPA